MARRGRRYGPAALSGIAVIAAGVGGLHYFQVAAKPPATPSLVSRAGSGAPQCTTTAALTTCTAAAVSTASLSGNPVDFRDGTYHADGAYLTPGGAEDIGVRLTLSGGRIVSAQVQVRATSPTARQFQRQFATRFARQVVSRPLAELAVTRVAGASLTSLGFDNALAQIRSAARAQD